MDTAYKKVKDKVKLDNLDQSNGSVPRGLSNWKQKTIEQKALLIFDLERKYAEWLISKFSSITRGSWLTAERLSSMIVGTEMTTQEKDVLGKMLYDREASIAFSFEEMRKVSHEVASPQKI